MVPLTVTVGLFFLQNLASIIVPHKLPPPVLLLPADHHEVAGLGAAGVGGSDHKGGAGEAQFAFLLL